jgi:hypothetical protein
MAAIAIRSGSALQRLHPWRCHDFSTRILAFMPPTDNDQSRLAHVALITAAAARNLDEDLPPLEQALRALPDIQISIVNWDDPEVDWSRFDLALLRSAWDYSLRLDEFLGALQRYGHAAAQPLPVVRWNTDKHYLRDLARVGSPRCQ